MTGLADTFRGFFSLPMTAGDRDRRVGTDELGRAVMETPMGDQYTVTEAAPVNIAEAAREFTGQARQDPLGTIGQVASALAQGAWNGIEAPGNALRGEALTYGDVADTALDWGVMGAFGRAPEGALRSGNWRDYGIEHRPMTVDGGAATLDDLTPAFGDDIYGPNAIQYFGGYDPREADILRQMQAARGNPDAMVSIYRGVPDDATGINAGDWVTLNREVAQEYGPRVVEMQVPARDVTSWPDSLLEFGYYPQSAAETPAQQVARLLREGRASEVTDDLMAQADPQEMYRLYEAGDTGMPMPMDEASRMARARDMGLADDQYHATTANFPAFMPSQTGLTGRGVYTGDFATDVTDYARVDGSQGLNVIPVRTPPERSYARRIDWQNTVDADPEFPYDATVDETVAGFARAADTMSEQGYAGVLSQPGERVTFNPASIRSRFARFDPRLRHLANLSAGAAGAGIALPYLQDDRDQTLAALQAYMERVQ